MGRADTIYCAGRLVGLWHDAMSPSPPGPVDPDAPVTFVFVIADQRLEIRVPDSNAGYCLRILNKWANKRTRRRKKV